MRPPTRTTLKRPMLYQLCRTGERFEVGDGPVALSGRPLVIGRGDSAKTDAGDGRLLVDDPWLSARHAQIGPLERRGTDAAMRARGPELVPGRFVVEDLGSTNGVLVNGAPATRVPLLHGDLIETGRTFWVYVEEPALDPMLVTPFEFGPVVTWTPAFAAQLDELSRHARDDAHVLLTGPEGSGKGFIARTLHQQGARTGRFVHLDCRERKQKRLAVDLFGSDGHPGRLRDAEGGTLFLENLDALPLELQDRLVEALHKSKTDNRTRPARVVAAMSAPMHEALAKNHVRQGLMDRLGAVSVRLPALTERLPDLGLLLDEFLARARGAPAISREAARVLMRTSFRLNVKALSRVVEAAASLAGTTAGGGRAGCIDLIHLPVEVVGPAILRTLMPSIEGGAEDTGEFRALDKTGSELPVDSNTAHDQATDPAQQRPHRVFARHASQVSQTGPPMPRNSGEAPIDPDALVAALRAAHGNVSAAARQVGRPRAFVQRLLKEFGIDPDLYR